MFVSQPRKCSDCINCTCDGAADRNKLCHVDVNLCVVTRACKELVSNYLTAGSRLGLAVCIPVSFVYFLLLFV